MSAVASVLIGLVSIQARRYQFWRAWIKALFWGGFILYLVANAILGALAVSLAQAVAWKPIPTSALWSGLLIAGTAQAAVRVELPRVLSDSFESGSSLLRRLVAFIIEFLNDASERSIQARLDALSDEQLISMALYLHGRYIDGDDELPEKTKALLLRNLSEAVKKTEDPTQRDVGRGSLELFCIREFTTLSLRPMPRLA